MAERLRERGPSGGSMAGGQLAGRINALVAACPSCLVGMAVTITPSWA